MRKILLTAVLLMLLASAALASDCATYCGTFAGYRWCNTRCR
jgi:opacity protein-like surface antigen